MRKAGGCQKDARHRVLPTWALCMASRRVLPSTRMLVDVPGIGSYLLSRVPGIGT